MLGRSITRTANGTCGKACKVAVEEERESEMGNPTDVMRKKFAALNAQDAKEMTGYFSPEAEREVPGGLLRGRDQIAAFVSVFWEAFPDLNFTVTSEVEEGPVVAIRGTMTGTHLGVFHTPAGDMPPTGRHIDLSFSDDYELQGGVIVSTHLHLDRLELLEQLGAVPAPTPA
jgi:predicted ester cyclase